MEHAPKKQVTTPTPMGVDVCAALTPTVSIDAREETTGSLKVQLICP